MITLKHVDLPINAVVSVPGSKSITNRALLLAALSDGVCVLKKILLSDDTHVFVAALRALGVAVELNADALTAKVIGCAGHFPNQIADIWCQDAGTAARFLLAACAANAGLFTFDGTARLRERPMGELVAALIQLGANISADNFPCTVRGSETLLGGNVVIASSKSSQYVSALLMVAPMCEKTLTIHIEQLKRRAYIDLSCAMMAAFGVVVNKVKGGYQVSNAQVYRACEYLIEPDLSTASYFFAAAAVTSGKITIRHLQRDTSLQGDIQFLDVLERMGCEVMQEAEGICIVGPEKLRGVSVDMQDFSDPFMTLACIAPFADTPTRITGIAHTRCQESDRIAAIASELKKLGVKVETGDDWICIYPSAPVAAMVDSHHDHRVAMSLSLIGLKVAGVKLSGAECVAKTCPDFFERFHAMFHTKNSQSL